MTDMEFLTTDLDIGLKPERPEAGAEMEIRVAPAGGGLAERDGLIAMLRDAEGEDLGTAPLLRDPDNGTVRAVLRVPAPTMIGEHRWSVCVTEADDPVAKKVLAFEVGAHVVRPSVWNLPPAITAGDRVRFTVGLACATGCSAADWAFVIEDAEGSVLHHGVTGPETLPGTEGLHGADIELAAPDQAGRHVWRVRPVDPGHGIAHAPIAGEIHLNVVRRPDRMIRVNVVDAVSGEPVPRARVVAHPFRAVTDDAGRAEIPVPSGSYRVFVSGHQYFPFQSEVDLQVEVDIEIVAEMHVDRPFDETDQWA
jgi:hypothetical protein